MAAAGALVVGVLAALGISGNLLVRMVRHFQWHTFWALVAVIVILSLLLITTLRKDPPAAILVAGLAVTLAFTAWLGAESQSNRENPSVSLSVTRSSTSGLSVTAKATGSGLRSDDKMLLRVLGIEESFETDQDLEKNVNEECRWGSLERKHPEVAQHVMAWIETGPNTSGDASTENTIPVPSDVRYVCAFAILSPHGDPLGEPNNWALIDLAYVTSSTVTTSSTLPPKR
jgi:hypothetical protein